MVNIVLLMSCIVGARKASQILKKCFISGQELSHDTVGTDQRLQRAKSIKIHNVKKSLKFHQLQQAFQQHMSKLHFQLFFFYSEVMQAEIIWCL
jgi:hypothetical protein